MSSRRKANQTEPRWVFVNYPMDKAYWPIFLSICFTIKANGFIPVTAASEIDSGKLRLPKIIDMMMKCPLAIHDISRVETFRGNMPLEVGIDLGLWYRGPAWQRRRKSLILDGVRHQYHQTISDLSGLDVLIHGNEQRQVIRHVRDWLEAWQGSAIGHVLPGAGEIHGDFQAFLTLAPDIIQQLRLDSLADLTLISLLTVIEVALPAIEKARVPR